MQEAAEKASWLIEQLQIGTPWTTSGAGTCSVWPTPSGLLEKDIVHGHSQKVNIGAGEKKGGSLEVLNSRNAANTEKPPPVHFPCPQVSVQPWYEDLE